MNLVFSLILLFYDSLSQCKEHITDGKKLMAVINQTEKVLLLIWHLVLAAIPWFLYWLDNYFFLFVFCPVNNYYISTYSKETDGNWAWLYFCESGQLHISAVLNPFFFFSGTTYNIIEVPPQKSNCNETLEGAKVLCSIAPMDNMKPSYYHSFGKHASCLILHEFSLLCSTRGCSLPSDSRYFLLLFRLPSSLILSPSFPFQGWVKIISFSLSSPSSWICCGLSLPNSVGSPFLTG